MTDALTEKQLLLLSIIHNTWEKREIFDSFKLLNLQEEGFSAEEAGQTAWNLEQLGYLECPIGLEGGGVGIVLDLFLTEKGKAAIGVAVSAPYRTERLKKRDHIDIMEDLDNFIHLDNQSEVFLGANRVLTELAEKIQVSNELRIYKEDRLCVISEINGLQSILRCPSVRKAAIWTATQGGSTLSWLTRQTASASISALAKVAIEHLIKLIGVG